MKNFPHQFSNLTKLTSALSLVQRLINEGRNVSDDGALGISMAREKIYTFRNLTTTIDERIAIESKKPLGNQGFRTAAREIRRFFAHTNLIHTDEIDYFVTKQGEELLSAKEDVQYRNLLWRDSLLNMSISGPDGLTSHPYRILLRLVNDNPGIETLKLLLALEARDDSIQEYDRISSLASLPSESIIKSIGTTKTNARNAVKILPALAEQLGDISRDKGFSFGAINFSTTEDELISLPERRSIEKNIPTPVDVENIAGVPKYKNIDAQNFDLSSGIKIRQRRTIRHNITVKNLAKFFEKNEYILFEFPFDCLARKEELGGFLIEVKTLDGSPSDERKQSEKALGQLRGYRHYNVHDDLKKPVLRDMVAYSDHPSAVGISFALYNGIIPVWNKSSKWVTSQPDGTETPLSPDMLLNDIADSSP